MKKESASSFLTEILSFLKRERERDFANLRTVYQKLKHYCNFDRKIEIQTLNQTRKSLNDKLKWDSEFF
jgi:hypothetical protein